MMTYHNKESKRALLDSSMKLYNKSYFEAARSTQKRSLLSVNEHFADKADAKRALLDKFIYQVVNAYI